MHQNAPAQDQSSESLVVRARTDREAFGQLFERHHSAIYLYCRRRLPDQAAAEDVCANAFLAVARKMARFPGDTDDDFKRWVYRIATHEINTHWRRSGRRAAILAAAGRRGEIQPSTADYPRPAPDDDVIAHLRQAIFQLSPRDQTLISLRYFESMSHDEIALILKMRSGAVRTALSRALDRLRLHLADMTGWESKP
jgi:RNA polymerase sigma-70 factor, ECF subfamily